MDPHARSHQDEVAQHDAAVRSRPEATVPIDMGVIADDDVMPVSERRGRVNPNAFAFADVRHLGNMLVNVIADPSRQAF
jgi:hypothetical protein